jgi:hypothetical protein
MRKRGMRTREATSGTSRGLNTIEVTLPNGCWDLLHRGVVFVRVGPASPTCNTKLRIAHNVESSQRKGPEYLHRGIGH